MADLRVAMAGLVREAASEWPQGQRLRSALAECLLVALERDLAEIDPAQGDATPLRGLWRWVGDHPGERWSLADLAWRARRSRAQLHRDCRRWYDCSPAAMVARLRLERASALLRDGGLTLDEIADRVGYGSGFALSRAFSRHHGLSPQRYRNTPLRAATP